jgi:hypothetical protein
MEEANEPIEPARFDTEARLEGVGKSDETGRGGKAEDGGDPGIVYGSGLRSPSGKTSSSARVESAAGPPMLAAFEVAELSQVLPETLLEPDSRGRADLD